jgi:hypothetical protein
MAAVRSRRDWVGTLDLAALEPAGRQPPVRAAPQPAWRRLTRAPASESSARPLDGLLGGDHVFRRALG